MKILILYCWKIAWSSYPVITKSICIIEKPKILFTYFDKYYVQIMESYLTKVTYD